ncbi:hypothetical protein D3C84_1271910 [compost metagenome]
MLRLALQQLGQLDVVLLVGGGDGFSQRQYVRHIVAQKGIVVGPGENMVTHVVSISQAGITLYRE